MSISGTTSSKQRFAAVAKQCSRRAACGITALSMILPLTANASTATASVAVSATIAANCTISATPLAFGSYTGAVNNNTATLTATCTNSTTYVVSLGTGGGTGASTTVRKMTGPSSALLNYAIYQDSARSTNFGNTSGTDTVSGTGNGSAQTITAYGQIPASQYSTPGAYTDTVTATLTY